MMHEQYEPVIGLEVHCQLRTASKAFSAAGVAYGDAPNTHVDPYTLGHPGTLPVLNRAVVKHAVRMGLATHCTIAPRAVFARKHYFYPDTPKGYQISQYDTPLCHDGYVAITEREAFEDDDAEALVGEEEPTKRIGLTRIHVEEDAGKLVHDRESGATHVDFNRCGVPLLEIVTAPDLRAPNEARRLLERIRQMVRYLRISDGNMEEGSLRCDANVSVRPRGAQEKGARTEIKNLNSMRHVEDALDYEVSRQIARRERGETVAEETLRWNADAGTTERMRTKEQAHDYRYFPDPDLTAVAVSDDWVEELREELPEMPSARRRRFVEEVGLPPYDADVLTEERAVADYFEETLTALFKRTKGGDTSAQAKRVSNFVMGEVMRVLNERDIDVDTLVDAHNLTPDRLASLIFLRMQERVSSTGAQETFRLMLEEEGSAGKVADNNDLIQVSDEDAIAPVVKKVLDDHPDKVGQYLSGKEGLIGFFIGQVRQRFDGAPNPEVVRDLLENKLEARRSD
jgi:aspartyl-tRNA(Asn)/glutamyl-tRNA(Gln) amidotransferase subunit B